ncbi:MAG: hypothetical protein ACXIUQ_15080 [Cecembia sp.]
MRTLITIGLMILLLAMMSCNAGNQITMELDNPRAMEKALTLEINVSFG